MGLRHHGLSLSRREGARDARVARHRTRALSGTLSRRLGHRSSSDTPCFEIRAWGEPRPPLGAAGEAGVTKPVWSIEEIEGAMEAI